MSEYGAGEWMVIALVVGLRLMLTEPKFDDARPVVWKSVVTRMPEEGILRRSDQEKYCNRTW